MTIHCLHVKGLYVDNFDLEINSDTAIESLRYLSMNNISGEVKSVFIKGNQNKEVMEQLSVCTGNVNKLDIRNSNNCMDWLTADSLSRWKLMEVALYSLEISTRLVLLIVQTCTELTSITLKLDSDTMDDDVVLEIAQHCRKLEKLIFGYKGKTTYNSLLALSEQCLYLTELYIHYIPNIPTADIGRRCSHALSCILAAFVSMVKMLTYLYLI